jgi:hypothetical protein
VQPAEGCRAPGGTSSKLQTPLGCQAPGVQRTHVLAVKLRLCLTVNSGRAAVRRLSSCKELNTYAVSRLGRSWRTSRRTGQDQISCSLLQLHNNFCCCQIFDLETKYLEGCNPNANALKGARLPLSCRLAHPQQDAVGLCVSI